ncbi:putative HMG box domain-containing protein [Seiridium unicorne]|uniref:HMG box domain-containing protein n=1 Tax=Seiridium unicorne TaxID=138068 RepID=A0ABR2VFR2_9PEZI
MARPKKEQKATAPAPVAAPVAPPALLPQAPPPALPQALPDNSATFVINRAEYSRLRDSVHSRLATIQELLRDFAADYLRQSNLLVGEPTSLENIPSLGALARLDGASLGFAPPAIEAAPPAEEKKERKKRQHDPNAPKRPLTPYFLYMQTARPIIANDLGQDAPKGAVQEEGQRRWAAMTPGEKNAWNNAYQFNLRLYNARVHSYKAGNLAARDMIDQDALTYADANQIPQPTLAGIEDAVGAVGGNDQDAIVEQLQMSAPVAVAAVPDEVAKTPKPKATRKRKSTAVEGVEEGEASAVKTATPASPDKKRKRQSKAAEPASEEPKKSGRKKKNA